MKTLRVFPVSRAGLYLSFQAQHSCMALLAVRAFIKKCPAHTLAFSRFPETLPRGLVDEAPGVCVENAATPPGEHARPPSMLCGEDGRWVGQPTTNCACRPGYEASDQRCRGEEEAEEEG